MTASMSTKMGVYLEKMSGGLDRIIQDMQVSLGAALRHPTPKLSTVGVASICLKEAVGRQCLDWESKPKP